MNYRKIFVIVGVLVAVTLLYVFVFSNIQAEDIQIALSDYGNAAPILYIGLFVILPIFFFPVAILALAGGLLFGLGWGSVYTFIGAMLNCMLMFILARYIGRKRIESLLHQRLSQVWQRRLAEAEGRRGFLLLVILRLIPAVPYNLINYAFGLTKMSFRTYGLASAIGIIPGTLVFINIGDKALDTSSPTFWLAIALLGGVLIVTSLLGKKLFPHVEVEDKN